MRSCQAYYLRAVLLGLMVVQLIAVSKTDMKHQFNDNAEPTDTIPLDLFEDILKSMAKRMPHLKDCFTLERFHNVTSEEHGITYADGSEMLMKFIYDRKCEEGSTPPFEEFDLKDVIRNLRELGYKGCNEMTSCFNEFTVENNKGSAIDIVRYIYQGQCLLPEKSYFYSEYLKGFEDNDGKASRSGFRDFLKRLGIGRERSPNQNEHSHAHENHDGKESETDDDYDRHAEDKEHAPKVDGAHKKYDKPSHGGAIGKNHGDSNEYNEKKMKTGDTKSNHMTHDETEDKNTNDDSISNSRGEKSDNRPEDNDGYRDEHNPSFISTIDKKDETGGNEDFRDEKNKKESFQGSTDVHKKDDSGNYDESDEATDITDDNIVGTGAVQHEDTQNTIGQRQNETANIDSPEIASEAITNSVGSISGEDEDLLTNGASTRRKRSAHLTKESRCYTSDQLLDIFEIDDEISDDKAMQLCPALIHQMKSDTCKSSHDHDHPSTKSATSYTQAMAYGYGTASVAVISLLALLGLALFPILESTTYKIIMQFFVGLAVGTLSSDALIHIIPQVLGVHDHDSHDDHGDEEYMEDKIFIWQMSVIFGGLYVVAGFESFLRAIKKSRSLQKHKRQQNTYQETPGIDNIPNESDPENAVTSFSCDVVSRDSLPEKHQKLSRSDSEQMLRRQDIVCCNFTPTLITVFIGDVLHNFADGLAIGVAFASHWSTGISTSIAILCHELPHEIGDFAIYLRNGASKWKAIGLNFTAACCNFVGLYSGINMASDEEVRTWLLCAIAGIFLYISLVQVMSTMLKDVCERPILQFLIQNMGMLLGWAIMLLIALYEDQIRIGI